MDKTAFVHGQLGEKVMSNRIGAVSEELAKRLNIAPEKALQLFYESQTCLYSVLYLVEYFLRMR